MLIEIKKMQGILQRLTTSTPFITELAFFRDRPMTVIYSFIQKQINKYTNKADLYAGHEYIFVLSKSFMAFDLLN